MKLIYIWKINRLKSKNFDFSIFIIYTMFSKSHNYILYRHPLVPTFFLVLFFSFFFFNQVSIALVQSTKCLNTWWSWQPSTHYKILLLGVKTGQVYNGFLLLSVTVTKFTKTQELIFTPNDRLSLKICIHVENSFWSKNGLIRFLHQSLQLLLSQLVTALTVKFLWSHIWCWIQVEHASWLI